MASTSKLYLADEPENFLDCSQEYDDIKALGKKLATLEKQLQNCQKAEATQLKEIRQSQEDDKKVLQLLQLEQMAYQEQNQHARKALFELHQETLALEANAEETFHLYSQLENIHRNEVNKYSALTKKLPELVQTVQAHERKLQKRSTQIEQEKFLTQLADKYMVQLIQLVEQRSTQPELVELIKWISTLRRGGKNLPPPSDPNTTRSSRSRSPPPPSSQSTMTNPAKPTQPPPMSTKTKQLLSAIEEGQSESESESEPESDEENPGLEYDSDSTSTYEISSESEFEISDSDSEVEQD